MVMQRRSLWAGQAKLDASVLLVSNIFVSALWPWVCQAVKKMALDWLWLGDDWSTTVMIERKI